MKFPKFYLLMLVTLLLFPLTRWLGNRNVPHFLFGFSSSFWAGVTIGVSIVCAAAFIALVVLQVNSVNARSPGGRE